MARTGITDERVQQVAAELEAEGTAATVSAIRGRLGTGSFTTIQAALDRWKADRKSGERPTPEPPARVTALVSLVWVEAWKTAAEAHDAEKRSFAEERHRLEKDRNELVAEVTRLEGETAAAGQLLDTLRASVQALEAAGHEAQLALARETAVREAAQQDVERLRGDATSLRQQLTEWVERATRAETQLADRIKPSAE